MDRLHQGVRQDFWRLMPDGGDRPLLAKLLSEDHAGIADHAALRHETRLLKRLAGQSLFPPSTRLRGGGVAGMAYDPGNGYLLSRLIERGGSMGVDEFLRLALRFCDQLAILHESGLLAGSLHPARWFWNEGTGKLWFLGLECAIDLTGDTKPQISGFGLDELVYLSPELAGTLPFDVGPGSDLYGLGCLFYYLLCGRAPFRGTSRLELAHEQLTGQGARLKQYRPHLPVALCQIVEQLMQPNPDNRYRSIGMVRRDIELCRRKKQAGHLAQISIGRRERQAQLAFPERYYGDVRLLSKLRELWQRSISRSRQAVMLTGPSHEMQGNLIGELRQTVLINRGMTITVGGDDDHFSAGAGPVMRHVLERIACALPGMDGDFAVSGRILRELHPDANRLLLKFAPGLATLFDMDAGGGQQDVEPSHDSLADFVVELFDCLLMPGRPILLVMFDPGEFDDLDALILRRLMARPGPRLMLIIGQQIADGIALRRADRFGLDDTQLLPWETLHVAAMNKIQLADYLADTLSVRHDMVEEMVECLLRKVEAWPEEIRRCLLDLRARGGLWYEAMWQRWAWSIDELDTMPPGTTRLSRLITGIGAMRGDLKDVLHAAAMHKGYFDIQSLASLSGLELRYVRAAIADARKLGILVYSRREYDLSRQNDLKLAAARLVARSTDTGQGYSVAKEPEDAVSRIWRFSHHSLREAAGRLPQRDNVDVRYLRGLLDLFWQGRLAHNQAGMAAGMVLDHLGVLAESDYPAIVDLMIAVSEQGDSACPPDMRHQCRQTAWSLLRPGDWDRHQQRNMFIGMRILRSLAKAGDAARFDSMLQELRKRAATDGQHFALDLAALDQARASGQIDQLIRDGMRMLSSQGAWYQVKHLAWFERPMLWASFLSSGFISGNVRGLAQAMKSSKECHIMDVAGRILSVLEDGDVLQTGLVLLMLRLTRRHGWHPYSGLAMAMYGSKIRSMPGAQVQGRMWGQLPLDLAGGAEKPLDLARICYVNGVMEEEAGNIRHALDIYSRGLSLSGEERERKYALICGYRRLELGFFSGLPLEELQTWAKALTPSDAETDGTVKTAHSIMKLLGLLTGVETKPGHNGQDIDPILTMLVHCLIGEFGDADILRDAIRSGDDAPNAAFLADHNRHGRFIDMLVLVCAVSGGRRAFDRSMAGRYLRVLEKQMRQSGSVYGARLLILQSELLRLDNRLDEAMDLLEKAMEKARHHQNHIEEILACLRLADILDHPGREEERRRALRFARNAALSWGSSFVVGLLETKYRDFLMEPLSEQRGGDLWQRSGDVRGQGIDIEAMAEASRIISGEVRLGELLKKMIRMVAGVAAAERALLILENEGTWHVQAELSGNAEQVRVLENRPLASDFVATSIVHYVVRTAEPVVLDDAARDQSFANDPYLLRQAPRSLVCLPLLHQSSIRAVLYLENNIVHGAFAGRSVEVLSLLSAQMAVSIENARLYERMEAVNSALRDLNTNLEETVAERTSALIDKTAVLESTIETMRDGLIAFDGQGRTREYNSGILHLFGLPKDSNLHDQDYRTVFGAFVRHALFGKPDMDPVEAEREIDVLIDPLIGHPQRSEYELELLTAGKRNLHLQFRRLNDGDGWMLKCVDVTDDRQRESDLRSAITRAEAANEAKSRFLATMSHEIRTPMNGVIGMIDLLQDTKLDTEQKELARIVGDSADNLLGIIDEILDFSKIEAGKLSIELVEFGLRDLIGQVIELMVPRANMKSLELAVHIDPDIPELLSGDPVRIRQVLINLIGNAIKFTATGHVAVLVHTDQDLGEACSLRFEIQDTGIGLSELAQEKLFEAFEQADASTTRRFGGTGLGLAISRNLVELMGGRIGVNSQEGQGALFWFSLPFQVLGDKPCADFVDLSGVVAGVAAELPVVQSGIEAMLARCNIQIERPGSDAWLEADIVILDEFRQPGNMEDLDIPVIRLVGVTGGKAVGAGEVAIRKPVRRQELLQQIAVSTGRAVVDDFVQQDEPQRVAYQAPSRKEALEAGALVLVAEDNITNQTVIARQLKRLGIACDIVDDGLQAWEALQAQTYGLLITDCHMPEMDGYALTGCVRAAEVVAGGERRLPVIALTANALAGEASRALEQGMDDFLSKPVKLDELEAVLLKWLPALGNLRQQEPEKQAHSGPDVQGDGFVVMPDAAEADRAAGDSGPRPDILNLELVLSVFGALNEDAMAMITRFIETTDPDIDALQMLSADAEEEVRHLSHQIAGAARTAGAIKVGDVALAMENRVLEGSVDEALDLRNSLVRHWQEVKNFVHELSASV